MKQKIRILIADDHAMVHMGLASLLKTEPDIEVVGEAEDGDDAVKKSVPSNILVRPRSAMPDYASTRSNVSTTAAGGVPE